MPKALAASVLFILIGCTSALMLPATQAGSSPKDGELTWPSDYKSYLAFLLGVQKPDAVRDLYINKTGATASHGQAFVNGTVLVMEIYNARREADGTFSKGPDGMLVKADLAKIFVMEKGAGWGKNAPAGLQHGDWIYSAFKPTGKRLQVDYTQCRACHLPLGEAEDFVHRYDEYFEKRGHMH